VVIENCVFRNVIGDSDAIDFDFAAPAGTPLFRRTRIENCVIDGSMDDGVDLAGASCTMVGNVIRGCGDKALSLEDGGPPDLGSPEILNNVIIRNGTAVALKGGVEVVNGTHNTIVGNVEGISVYDKRGGDDGARGEFSHCIVWHNKRDVLVDRASRGSIAVSDIGDAVVWEGAGSITDSISTDPLFISEYEDAFHLSPESPCILPDDDYMGALPPCLPGFVRGEANGDGAVDLSDAIFVIVYLFQAGASPECPDACDANDNGTLTLADPIYLLTYLYAGGPPPPAPFGTPGDDPTADILTCSHTAVCP
jgi:hypothetical protein